MSTDYVYFWKSIHTFKEHRSFVWIYSQLQIHTMLYVGSAWTIEEAEVAAQDRTVWKILTSQAASTDMHDADW